MNQLINQSIIGFIVAMLAPIHNTHEHSQATVNTIFLMQ